MRCDNIVRGCTWVGTVGTLEEHVATCKFTLLPCPKECKDGSDKVKQFMRQVLDTHLQRHCPNRDYSCQHCGQKGTYASIQVHDKTCGKKEVTCPEFGCKEKMQRQHVPEHVKTDCQHTTISCKYLSIGCKTQLKRKDMAAHEQDSEALHLSMALDRINVHEVECFTLKNGEPIKLKLTEYQMKKENNECVESPSYYTSPNGYHMAISVDVNGDDSGEGTHVSVYAKFLKGEYDAQLKWPFVGKMTFTLLNQLEDKNHHWKIVNLTKKDNIQAGMPALGYGQFIPHSALDYDAVSKTQYLKDDTLYFRMSVEPADHKPWLQ